VKPSQDSQNLQFKLFRLFALENGSSDAFHARPEVFDSVQSGGGIAVVFIELNLGLSCTETRPANKITARMIRMFLFCTCMIYSIEAAGNSSSL
jgi:hypothetical protein